MQSIESGTEIEKGATKVICYNSLCFSHTVRRNCESSNFLGRILGLLWTFAASIPIEFGSCVVGGDANNGGNLLGWKGPDNRHSEGIYRSFFFFDCFSSFTCFLLVFCKKSSNPNSFRSSANICSMLKYIPLISYLFSPTLR